MVSHGIVELSGKLNNTFIIPLNWNISLTKGHADVVISIKSDCLVDREIQSLFIC